MPQKEFFHFEGNPFFLCSVDNCNLHLFCTSLRLFAETLLTFGSVFHTQGEACLLHPSDIGTLPTKFLSHMGVIDYTAVLLHNRWACVLPAAITAASLNNTFDMFFMIVITDREKKFVYFGRILPFRDAKGLSSPVKRTPRRVAGESG